MADLIYFSADDGVHGRELWVSDGTPAGTHLFLDIATGADSSNPSNLCVCGGKLFFDAFRVGIGYTLWVSDGTIAGTESIADIDPSTTANEFSYDWGNTYCAVGSTFFFNAIDPVQGSQLWKSDGTAAGTQVVLDVSGNQPGGSPVAMTAMGGNLYFTSRGDPDSGLWISDGTSAGTHAYTSTIADCDFTTAIGGTVYVRGTDIDIGNGMFATEGDPADLTLLSPTFNAPSRFIDMGGLAYCDPIVPALNTRPLVVSDGTPGGTTVVADVFFDEPVVVGSALYFGSPSPTLDALWVSDGTGPGTLQVTSQIPDAYPVASVKGLVLVGQKDSIQDYSELWASNGSDAGTVQLLPKTKLEILTPQTSGVWQSPHAQVPISGLSDSSQPITYTLSGATSGSGTAAGTVSWSFTPTFQTGLTTVTITAIDAHGASEVATLQVNYEITPPVITIFEPTTTPTYSTTSPSLRLSCLLSSPSNVTSFTGTMTGATTGTQLVQGTSSSVWNFFR